MDSWAWYQKMVRFHFFIIKPRTLSDIKVVSTTCQYTIVGNNTRHKIVAITSSCVSSHKRIWRYLVVSDYLFIQKPKFWTANTPMVLMFCCYSETRALLEKDETEFVYYDIGTHIWQSIEYIIIPSVIGTIKWPLVFFGCIWSNRTTYYVCIGMGKGEIQSMLAHSLSLLEVKQWICKLQTNTHE